ncbi:helix-turn-helix transcriptional regulator [Aureispira anguillae]|uniref:Helix-turn-helix transcriptional regulator n=1 Tax=Aureispira anguillae TaxID=2864201 RepID=A0A916DQE1_9BACT|nr:helix-turn-helix transcriptional regulator [Aureispira anguillae]BDS10665.1 helix-turn-helix transcriptional regulator [Aureispira anguillae]BDS10671.1 helix-turn-helix transcriptional regulator [Aureispira anguillae]
MSISNNIKLLREKKGLLQKQVALELGIGYSNYNKLEKGDRGISLEELIKIAKFYNLSIDEIVFLDEKKAIDIQIQDKPKNEQLELLEELDEEDKSIIYKLINTMLTKKRMKELLDSAPNTTS